MAESVQARAPASLQTRASPAGPQEGREGLARAGRSRRQPGCRRPPTQRAHHFQSPLQPTRSSAGRIVALVHFSWPKLSQCSKKQNISFFFFEDSFFTFLP